MILIDGRTDLSISPADRGLNYGDGLFETLRLRAGVAPLLSLHLARLRAGCERLDLTWPGDRLLRAEIAQVAATAPSDAVLKIILTRGDGARGYAPEPGQTCHRIISSHPLPDGLDKEVSVGVCVTRLTVSQALQGLKHLGRLEQVLGAREARLAGWDEGLMMDASGTLVEGTRHHFFWVRRGQLETVPSERLAVDGIMRRVILEAIDAESIHSRGILLGYDDLPEIEEMFLCNAVVGLRSVNYLEGRRLTGRCFARRLRSLLARRGTEWLG